MHAHIRLLIKNQKIMKFGFYFETTLKYSEDSYYRHSIMLLTQYNILIKLTV